MKTVVSNKDLFLKGYPILFFSMGIVYLGFFASVELGVFHKLYENYLSVPLWGFLVGFLFVLFNVEKPVKLSIILLSSVAISTYLLAMLPEFIDQKFLKIFCIWFFSLSFSFLGIFFSLMFKTKKEDI